MAWLIFGLWPSLLSLGVGVVVLDLAVQGALISNQHLIFGLRPQARARISTIFMGSMFVGGAAGSAFATAIWFRSGWSGVVMAGIAAAALALVLKLTERRASLRVTEAE
ncbi:hypothetical protein [Paracoccus benzoatiresistens]|uniref:MFS transporter n=1 Tax=Paracoccus benzoatiresistens TaxID=2997341 RepID=A0ABT4JBP1_9RHOB|nr:hypothetical protein [Paracoccus sp. EF6]MCZ0964552.1 hypothetical protein [Paracoccus sp. EF6]